MEKTKKQPSSKLQNNSSIDRLSSLPDAILHHILSFLPTKSSIATSVLSKRWRLLWTFVPILDFDTSLLRHGTMFSDVINRVLLLYNRQTITTFRLYHEGTCRRYDFESWIVTLMSRKVQNLDLCVSYRRMSIPKCLFTCKTLVDLRIGRFEQTSIPSNVCLPALKKLHLDEMYYESNEFLPTLISGCPVLEELIVDRTEKLVSCCYISSPTLTRLKLICESCGARDDVEVGATNRLKIDTPALKY